MQGRLPTLGRLLEVARAQPLLLCACLGMEGEQIGPQASRLGTHRLTLSARGGGEAPQGDETDDALRPRVLMGRRPPPVLPAQENTGYPLEQMFVNGQKAMHPRHE